MILSLFDVYYHVFELLYNTTEKQQTWQEL